MRWYRFSWQNTTMDIASNALWQASCLGLVLVAGCGSPAEPTAPNSRAKPASGPSEEARHEPPAGALSERSVRPSQASVTPASTIQNVNTARRFPSSDNSLRARARGEKRAELRRRSAAPKGSAELAALNSAEVAQPEAGAAPNATADKPCCGGVAPLGKEASRLVAQGNRQLESEQYARALGLFRRAMKLENWHPAPVVGLVQAKVGAAGIQTEYAGAPGDARFAEWHRLLRVALERAPQYGETHLEIGRLYLIAGEAAAAAGSLERAIALLPSHAEAHSALAVSRLAQGRKGDAVLGFERAADLDPQNPARLTNLGASYLTVGDAERAVLAFRGALKLAPNDARIHSDLGTALLGANDVQQSLPHLKRAVQLEPKRATFRNNLGYALQRTGDVQGAVAQYQAAIRLAPRLGSAWINLGTAHAKQRQFGAARAAFDKAAALDPTDPRVEANLAELEQLEQQSR